MPLKLTEFMFERIGVPNFAKYLDLAAFRHKLIAGNVANTATPGYRRHDIDFKTEFEKTTAKSGRIAGRLTHPNHIPVGNHQAKPPKVHKAKVAEGEMNSVDIDREVSTLAKNELMFSIGAILLQKKLGGLRKAIVSK